MLSAEHMRSLPAFFAEIPDPRRAQGRRHPLPAVLAISAAAVLCGARGYKAISEWAEDLGQKARARFRCRYRNGRYEVPSRTLIRDVLTRVDPDLLDHASSVGRALSSQDHDLLREAAKCQDSGIPFAGVIYAHQLNITVGQTINDLQLIAEIYEPEDIENRVEYLPL